jgi:predicted dehydrogenase
MRRLRIGIIGLGGIAQMMHLPHFAEHDERFELVALADTHRPTLEAVGARYHVPNLYTDYREMLSSADVEAVGIFHGGSHRDSVIAALHAGKHVFVEKPLAWNAQEVEEIAEAAQQSGTVMQIGYHKRYDPGFLEARKLVADMSDIAYARITVLHPEDTLGWAAHRVRRGDGVIVEGHRGAPSFADAVRNSRQALAEGALAPAVDAVLGARRADPRLRLAYGMATVSLIHQVYMLWGFLGEPQHIVHTDIWRDGLSIHSLFAYPTGLRVALDWHWLGDLKDYKEEYAFFGSDQRIYLTFPSPYFRNFPTPITVQGHDGETAWEKRIIVNYEEAFLKELLAFHDNVLAGRQPETGIAEALAHARFIERMIGQAV